MSNKRHLSPFVPMGGKIDVATKSEMAASQWCVTCGGQTPQQPQKTLSEIPFNAILITGNAITKLTCQPGNQYFPDKAQNSTLGGRG